MRPINVIITKIIQETPTVKTFFFDVSFKKFKPGQFVMVWIRGIDEIPMTLSYQNAITVRSVGDATEKLFELNEGDSLGIRGPFGNGFSISHNKSKILIIAGGIGAAPLVRISELFKLKKNDIKITTILGCQNSDELIFMNRFKEQGQVYITTDDGSEGTKGFVTDILKRKNLSNYDKIFVCGPEVMMVAVFKILQKKDSIEKSEFSLHRYFKCGIGVCGACCMDSKGLMVCKDGPVFQAKDLIDSEFGLYMRNASGQKQKI